MKTTRKKNIFKKRTYKIGKEETNNQNIYTKQQIVIKKKNWIKKGTLLTENTHIKNGRLCLGKNLLTAYIPIEGYNFEDAIVINKKLIEQKSFMSMHIKKYINFIINNEMGKVRKLKLIIKNKKAKIKIELKLKRKY